MGRISLPLLARHHPTTPVVSMSTSPAPASVDWVAAGKVSPVKDQGKCGACWSFGTIGAIEGAYAISSGKLLELSNQDLLSCMSKGSPLNVKEDGFACGCSGGDPDGAFRWVHTNGIELWSDRPYTNETKNCDGMY